MAALETHAAGAPLLPVIDLSRERREERRGVLRRSRRHTAAILAAIVLTVAVPLPLTLQALTLYRESRTTEHQVAGVQQRLKRVMADGGEVDAKISRWTRLVESQQARHAWGGTLPALAACLPDDVCLQQVQISCKGRGTQVQLQGTASTMTGLHAFTAALAHSSVFAHMHLDETTVSSSGATFRIAGPLSGAMAGGVGPSAP